MCFKTKKITKIHPLVDCVICLSPVIKYTSCSRCNECGICKECFHKLVKSGHNRCPICNLECDKCKRGEKHPSCDWVIPVQRSSFASVIDICPNSSSNSQLDLKLTTPYKKYACWKTAQEILAVIGRAFLVVITTLLLVSIALGLTILVGIFIQSIINPDSMNMSSVEFIFINSAVGILVFIALVCIASTPCCCDVNVVKCIVKLYCIGDR